MNIKSFAAGAVAATIVTTSCAFAAPVYQTLNVAYDGIKVYINGTKTEMKDPNGLTVDPFVCNGTTYVPLRAVSEALGQKVLWDGNTKSIYIGETAAPSAPSGYSRTNPAPIGTAQTVKVSEYDGDYTATVKVNQTKTGREALEFIKEQNMFNSDPAAGYTYHMVHVSVRIDSVEGDKSIDVNQYDFKAFSSDNAEREMVSVVINDGQRLDQDVYAGGTAEGWIVVQAKETDTDLKVAYGLNYKGEGGAWLKI